MANRVISIEVGKSITRAVEMDYKAKNPKVCSCFSFETPEGVWEDGMIRPDDNFCNVLKGAMKYFRIKTKKVVFSLNSGRIANREITIPLVKENKIATMLIANSSEYFPVDLTQYQLVHRIIEKVDTKEDKHYKLSVLAVPNDLVKSYERLAQDCGLTIMALDYVGNSIGQVMKRNIHEEGIIMIKVDETASTITVTKNGQVDLQRNISYGIEDAVETMIETSAYGEDLSYADALQIMRRKNCIRRRLDVEVGYAEEEDVDESITRAREEITESLRMLIGNIGRVLDYYISRNAEVDIKHIKLIGLGADCGGLSKLMTNELGIKVTPFQKFPEINLNRSLEDPSFKIAEYISCIGAALNPLHFRFGGEDGTAKEQEDGSFVLPGLVFFVCAAACAGMVGISVYQTMTLEKKQEDYHVRISELYPAKQTFDARNAANEELASCQNVYALTKTPVDQFMKFIDEMETNMPSDIMISSLTTNAEGITMNIAVSTKESLAEVLIQLRAFDTIQTVSCTAASQSEDESGNVTINATITCTYDTGAAENAAAD